ncbi:MAG: type II secretion system F family protein [Planctomycetaceae bacterium]|nr:type II secretion system F family protein [Planctomycetaceae bacterium]
MPSFQYLARDLAGRQVVGTLSEANRSEALTVLVRQSLVPVELTQVGERASFSRGVSAADRAAMFSLLADLLDSGVPLIRSLEVLIEQTSHSRLRETLGSIREQVVDGTSLADAMRSHRTVFNDLSISMVRAGEEGGFLEDSLKRIAAFTEKQEAMRSRVLGALAYPAFLLVVGILVLVGMMMFFVPRFAPLFERLRDENALPFATVMLLSLSSWMRAYGILIGIASLGCGVFLYQFLQTDSGRATWDRTKLSLGPLGSIFRNLAIARFSRALGTLLANGVPLVKSLNIAREATANSVLSKAIEEVTENVQSGKSLVAPLASSGQFPKEVLEMIHVGEQSNRLETLLVDIADKIEARTERKLDVLVKLIEPSLMLVMALLIGFLIVALLLPVFESSGNLG